MKFSPQAKKIRLNPPKSASSALLLMSLWEKEAKPQKAGFDSCFGMTNFSREE
jgi:hypothetical protein